MKIKKYIQYLKSYKIFESLDSKLTDCLVELFDYGFEIQHIEGKESVTGFLMSERNQLLIVKLFKRFPNSVTASIDRILYRGALLGSGKFSNRLEGNFDKDNFVPDDRNTRTRGYIENELIEMTDEVSNKIINIYIPEATRGVYVIDEFISYVEGVNNVTIILKFFK